MSSKEAFGGSSTYMKACLFISLLVMSHSSTEWRHILFKEHSIQVSVKSPKVDIIYINSDNQIKFLNRRNETATSLLQ